MATYVPSQLYQVPLAELQPEPAQPRKYMDPAAQGEMTTSLGRDGINRDEKSKSSRQRRRPGGFLCAAMLILPLWLLLFGNALADMNEEIRECAALKDDSKRLQCFDRIAGLNNPATAAAPADPGKDGRPVQNPYPSIMDRHFNLGEERRTEDLFRWHRPSYFLFGAYNSSPNREMTLDVDPSAKAKNTEAIFQLSGKVRLLRGQVRGRHVDAWVGYTQRSFWQLYNSAFSAPFRDTSYEPEGFFTIPVDRDTFRFDLLDLRIVNLGFVHQSNGRARPLSRSWNRVFTEFGFEKIITRRSREEGGNPEDRNEFNLFVKPWHRLPEDDQDDDNPNIEKYLGYGEISGAYYWRRHRFALMLRNNLRANENKGALQFDWSFPICLPPISGYVQYFNGYGESLLDYNSSSNRISVGFMLTNW